MSECVYNYFKRAGWRIINGSFVSCFRRGGDATSNTSAGSNKQTQHDDDDPYSPGSILSHMAADPNCDGNGTKHSQVRSGEFRRVAVAVAATRFTWRGSLVDCALVSRGWGPAPSWRPCQSLHASPQPIDAAHSTASWRVRLYPITRQSSKSRLTSEHTGPPEYFRAN